MAKGEGGRPGSDETKYIAALVLIIGVGWLLWTFGRGVLALMLFGMDWLQLEAAARLGVLSPNSLAWRDLQRDIVLSVVGVLTPGSDGFVDVYALEWGKHFAASSEVVGQWTRWPIAALLLALTVFMAFRMRGERFKRHFSLTGRSLSLVYRTLGWTGFSGFWTFCSRQSNWHPFSLLLKLAMLCRLVSARREWVRDAPDFAGYQAQHWRVAMVGAHFDPDKDVPEWQQLMTPPEWLKANNVSLTPKGGLDQDAAGRAFARQLGVDWQGVRSASYYAKAICILSTLNRMWDTKRLNKLLSALAVIHVQRAPREAAAAAEKLLAPFLDDDKLVSEIDKVAGQHHYANTAILRVYGWGGPFQEWGGGEGASLAPSQFLWLKPLDRSLWYALHQNGRRAYMVEGAGPVSHYFYERIGRRPLSTPKVENAIEGLEKYLNYHHITDLEVFLKENGG